MSFQRTNIAPLVKGFDHSTLAIVDSNDYSQTSADVIYMQASLLRIAEDANRFRRENHMDAETICVNLECFRCEMDNIVASVSRGAQCSSDGSSLDW